MGIATKRINVVLGSDWWGGFGDWGSVQGSNQIVDCRVSIFDLI
jgi:hypothetical protein